MAIRIVIYVILGAITTFWFRKEDRRRKLARRWQMTAAVCGILFVNLMSWGDAAGLAGSRFVSAVFGLDTSANVEVMGGATLKPEFRPPPEATVTPAPSATPDVPRLTAGTVWYSAPNIEGSSGVPMGDMSGQEYVLVGRAGNPPWTATCYCYMIEIPNQVGKGGIIFDEKKGPSGRGWVLAASIPMDNTLLLATALTKPDQTQ